MSEVPQYFLSHPGSGMRPFSGSDVQGYPGHEKQPPPQDSTVGLCPGPCRGPSQVVVSYERGTPVPVRIQGLGWGKREEFFIGNLLVRIHFISKMILAVRHCAMGV